MKECISVNFSLNGLDGKAHIEIPKVIGTDQKNLPILLSQRNRELVKSMVEEKGVSFYRLDRQTGSSTCALISSYLFARYLSTNVLYLSRNNRNTLSRFEHFDKLKNSFTTFLEVSKKDLKVNNKSYTPSKQIEERSILFMDFDKFVPILLSGKAPKFERWNFNLNGNLAVIFDNVEESLLSWTKSFGEKLPLVYPKEYEFSKRWIIIETSDVR